MDAIKTWSRSETEHFIDLCIENNVPSMTENKKHQYVIFSKIRDGMAVGGYKRDSRQLYNKYRMLKDSINTEAAKTKAGRSEIPFFDKLEALFTDRLPKIETLIDDTYDEDCIETNDDFLEKTLPEREEWDYIESEKFIDLCIQNNIVTRLGSNTERKVDLFEALQDELRLAGFDRETSQLINQFQKLKKSYENARQSDSTDDILYDKLGRLFEETEPKSRYTKNRTGGKDTFDFINTIRRNPIIWNTQYKCSSGQRTKTWEVIASNYGLDLQTARSKWRTLRDYITRTRRKPIEKTTQSTIQLIRAMSFMPIAREVLSELGCSLDADDETDICKVEVLQDMETVEFPSINDGHSFHEENTMINDDVEDDVQKSSSPPVKRLRRILPAPPAPVPMIATPTIDKKQFKYVKLTSLADKNTPATQVFQLVNPIERNSDPLSNIGAGPENPFDEDEYGYALHVAQQLRKLPQIKREQLRNQINNLMHNAIVSIATDEY